MILETNLRRLKSRFFTTHGRRPYARGYGAYRQTQLQDYINRQFPGGELPDGWGLWLDERAIEYPWLFSRLPDAAGKLLDAGSVLNFAYILDHPKLRNKGVSIFTLAPESECHWSRGVSYFYGDLRNLCIRDAYFDSIVCVSTLEHIGMNNTAFYTKDRSKNECDVDAWTQALLELHRVLKSGGTLFATVPFGLRQNLGWLQIFDHEMVDRLIDTFQPSSIEQRYFRYTASGWKKSSPGQVQDATYFDRWHHRPDQMQCAAAEAVVCLELVK